MLSIEGTGTGLGDKGPIWVGDWDCWPSWSCQARAEKSKDRTMEE